MTCHSVIEVDERAIHGQFSSELGNPLLEGSGSGPLLPARKILCDCSIRSKFYTREITRDMVPI